MPARCRLPLPLPRPRTIRCSDPLQKEAGRLLKKYIGVLAPRRSQT